MRCLQHVETDISFTIFTLYLHVGAKVCRLHGFFPYLEMTNRNLNRSLLLHSMRGKLGTCHVAGTYNTLGYDFYIFVLLFVRCWVQTS